MVIAYIGVVSVYIVFISGVIQESVGPNKTISHAYYALILFPFLLLINMIKTMKVLAPFSICGNISLAAAAVIGVTYALKDGIGETWTVYNPDLTMYPKFLGTVFFGICSPGLVNEVILFSGVYSMGALTEDNLFPYHGVSLSLVQSYNKWIYSQFTVISINYIFNRRQFNFLNSNLCPISGHLGILLFLSSLLYSNLIVQFVAMLYEIKH